MSKTADRVKYDEPEWALAEMDKLFDETINDNLSPSEFMAYVEKHGSRALLKELRRARRILLG